MRAVAGSWAGGSVRLVVSPDQFGHQRGNGVGVDRFSPAGRENVAVLGAPPGVSRPELVGGLARKAVVGRGYRAVRVQQWTAVAGLRGSQTGTGGGGQN